ncbi:MAG TPA: AarF/UbiB family protein [Sandaracinaceae bacterium LLY-WYZ-13_1]|nr:AarF/UbiB family protein [Sandaracinaceae bacterium LLY-WYZ-13_1]
MDDAVAEQSGAPEAPDATAADAPASVATILRRGVDFALRGTGIALVGLASMLHFCLGVLFLEAPHDTDEWRDRVWHLAGRSLRWGLATLGASFIKLGQVLSTRPDLFPTPFIEELRLLQDRLPPFSFESARRRIEEDLGGRLEEHFAELEREPVAAASVAQVHRGVLHDGAEVAVKVLRPDVRRKAERDGAILMWGARVAERLHPVAAHAELSDHVSHFVDGIVEQTDLSREIRNYATFRENFAEFEHVRFPRVYPRLSSSRVMTMEFLRGTKVDALPPGRHRDIAERLRRVFLKMLFDDGFLHADLHPGNLMITDDGQIAIFDVGLVEDLSEELLVHYIEFNKCLVMGTVADVMQYLRTYHTYVEGEVNWVKLEADVTAFAEEFRRKSAAELEMGEMINEIFRMGREHGVRPIPEMTLIMVGVVTAEGIGKQLDPGSNSFQEVASYLVPVLTRRGMMTPELMTAAASRMFG